MRRSIFSFFTFLALGASLPLGARLAHAGTITLNSGKTLEGTVSLIDSDANGANIQLESAGGQPQTFKFSDVKTAVFDGLAGGVTLGGGGVPWVRTELAGEGEERRAPIAQIAGDKITIIEPQSAPVQSAPAPQKGDDKGDAKKAPPPIPSLAENACFVFQKLDWDGEILARITFTEPGAARAGLMICEGLDGQGPMALISRSAEPAAGNRFLRRGTRGEPISPIATAPSANATWLKLTRSWDSVRALESADGAHWNPIGEARIEMDDRRGVYIGVVARATPQSRITFDNIKLAGRRSSAVVPGEADPRLRDVSVMLKDGTILAGMLESVTAEGEGKIKIANRGPAGERVTIKPGLIARAQFAPMNPEQNQIFLTSNVGAITREGDFLEGDLKDIKNGSVTVSSIAFGLTTLEPGRVLGIILQPPPAPDAPPAAPKDAAEVRLQDGSLIFAAKLNVEKGQLVIDEPLVGPLKFNLEEVISINRK